MEYRKFGGDYVLRLVRGDEILASVKEVCEKENIALGTVSGLGAVNFARLGIFNSQKRAYEEGVFEGDMEIASCGGNISRMNGEVYLHIHMVAANPVSGLCAGGHLSEGRISFTGEFFIHRIDGEVERRFDEGEGINVFKLD